MKKPNTLKLPSKICAKIFPLVLLAALTSGCATAPKVSTAHMKEGAEFSLLPPGALAYIWADAEKARPIADAISFNGIDTRNAGAILDRTDTATAAVFPAAAGSGISENDARRRFYLAAFGSYPSGRANLSLRFSKGWKKERSPNGGRYWFSQKENLGIAVSSNLALVSNGDPFGANLPPVIPPEGFIDFKKGTVFSGWVNEPSVPISNFLASLGIPIQIPAEDFFFSLSAVDDGLWEAVFKTRISSPLTARLLFIPLSIAVSFIQHDPTAAGAAGMLFANQPQLDGEFIILKSAAMNEEEIALLFGMFTLYSSL